VKADLESRLKVVLSGKYRLLERDAAKTAIDLNLAAAEFKGLGGQVAEQEQAHEQAQADAMPRRAADRGAHAALRNQRGSRATAAGWRPR